MQKCFTLILLLFLTSAGYGQFSITGEVVVDDTGEPLPGVNVLLKGTNVGTVTDVNGFYSLQVPDGTGTLQFSFIGLQSKEVAINNRSIIDIQLTQDIQQLGEIVVTALGIERQEASLGYAVQDVDADELLKARETNIANSLAGKVAGVAVTQSTSGPGASTRIVIRGNSSIAGNNQPLYVIDGVPISNSNISSVDRFTSPDYGNRITDINPDDIAKMTILKGPSATALYGQRAANGAIIITTKKGKKDQKTSITINSSVRFDNPLRLPDYQNVYGQGSQAKLDSASSANFGPMMDGRTFINANGNQDIYQAYPDNISEFYETGKTIINSVSLQGGGEKSAYRFGLTNLDQAGIAPNTNLNRINLNLNASQEFSNKFYSSVGANYIRTRNTGRVINGFNSDDAVASVISFMPRNFSNDSLRNFKQPDGSPRYFLGLSQNPYWTLNENVFTSNLDRLIGFGQIGFRPYEWLDISWKVGIDLYTERRKKLSAVGSVGQASGGFWTDDIFEEQINSDFFININRNINPDLGFSLLLGHNVNEQYVQSAFNRAQELTDPLLYIPDNARINTPEFEVVNHIRIIGLFFDLGLSYKDYLYLNITGRNDWNSTLPKENNSFFYPSVSASAILSDMFVINSSILSLAKLRANVSQVGSGTDAYQLGFTYLPQTSIFQLFTVDNSYPFRGIPGFEGTDLQPPPPGTLQPEISTSWEIGTDLRFFNNRIGLDFTYYNVTTTDQILTLTTPSSTGFTQALVNAGTVVNRGIELMLNARPIYGPDFNWVTSANFARNRNETTELPEGYDFVEVPGTRTDPTLRAYLNEPTGAIVGSGWRRDSEGNLLINPETGLRLPINDQIIGNVTPDFQLGWQNEISYKGISLSFLLDWRQGGQLHSQTVQDLRAGGHVTETLDRDVAYIDNGVILLEEDDQGNAISTRPNDIPITYQQFWGQQNVVDEEGVFDATYVKLREARFSYSLPQAWLENSPFGNIEIGIEGRNLALLFSKIPHIDPEVSFYGPTNAQGIEAYNMPSTRSFGGNVKITF
ncbi:MAG: SusC/RagA family TonB-linked outer membrane protein [Candidatus Cyclobacteriaceae bacterium M3_2C_046]